MDLAPWLVFAVIGMLVVVVAMYSASRRRDAAARERRTLRNLDPVNAWPPEATRILTTHERTAYLTLVRALPEHVVLAQVPLSRFLKVPRRHSYAEWLNRVGQLSVDLIVCDKASQPIAVVEVHASTDSARSKERHDVMARVLKAAKIRCIVWMEGAFPTPDAAREQLFPTPPAPPPGAAAAQVPAVLPAALATTPARPGITTIPVAEAEEVDETPLPEPMPSTWFDELESGATPLEEKRRT
jgi:hypothetical protein